MVLQCPPCNWYSYMYSMYTQVHFSLSWWSIYESINRYSHCWLHGLITGRQLLHLECYNQFAAGALLNRLLIIIYRVCCSGLRSKKKFGDGPVCVSPSIGRHLLLLKICEEGFNWPSNCSTTQSLVTLQHVAIAVVLQSICCRRTT